MQSMCMSLAAACAVLAPCMASTADSQSRSAGAAGPGETLQEVVVTGSRLAAGFAAVPTPVTAISVDQLLQVSPNDVATALAQAPALGDTILGSNAGSASGAAGTNGQSLLNLRGLGVNRTLVLLNGQRLGTTNVQDSVDINMIPQSLLKRVDIVTGGASASYGSDAVAGVVNFVLDTNFQGFKADVSAGTTTYHDASNGNLALAFGKSLGGNGRLIAGLNLYKQGGVGLPPSGRGWNDSPYAGYPNPVSGAQPTFLVVPNARSSNGTYGGLITGVQGCSAAACTALVNQQFAPGGVLQPFQQGTSAGSSYASGGQGADMVFGISPAQDREGAFLHTEWDVSPAVTLFSEGIVNRTHTVLKAQSPYETGTVQFTIFRNNAFLPAAVAAVFSANPTLTSFTLGRLSPDISPETVRNLTGVGRLAVGAKGNLGGRWTFDTSIAQQYTVNNIDVLEPIKRNLYAAADAVVNPAGQTVCNSTLQGLDPGCVPINLFGVGAPSAAASQYVLGVNRGDTVFRQTAFEANLRGSLGQHFDLGAGSINMATGIAWRKDSADRQVDPLSAINTTCAGLRGCPATYNNSYGGYQYYNPAPLSGSTRTSEVYAEFGIPLLKDLPLVQSLDAVLAGRSTRYSASGSQGTFKMGLQWALDNAVRLRGTFSQDARAPDVLELFSAASTKVSFDLFPSSTAATTTRVSAVNAATGNPNLLPEIAHTSTAGIVLSPATMPGFQASADYYKVRINKAIEALSNQGVVDGCAAGNAAYCGYITVNGVPITSVSQVTAATTGLTVTGPRDNVGVESTSGIDLESMYSHTVPGGTLSARVIGNYLLTVDRPTAITGCAQTSLIGAIGGCLGENGYPRWRGNVSVRYDSPRYSVNLQERFISGGKADPWDVVGVTVNRNDVPTVQYTDLTLNFNIPSLLGLGGRAYLTVTNLFDKAPPPTIISSGAFDAMTSYDVYDVLGRRYVLGFRTGF